jgi:hypothetical protein
MEILPVLSGLFRTLLQQVPVFDGATGMGYYNGSANDVGYRKNLQHFRRAHFLLEAFFEVVFDAVVAAQHHGSYQAQHLFGTRIQCSIGIGVGIEVKQSFDDQVVGTQQALIHFGAVIPEFF